MHDPAPRLGGADWVDWHRAYRDPQSNLSRRLLVVQRFVRAFLDSRDGDLRIISLCAGEGRDLLGVLARHPARTRLRARLVELDPVLVEAASAAAGTEGLAAADVVARDAFTFCR